MADDQPRLAITPAAWLARISPHDYYRQHSPPYDAWLVYPDATATSLGRPYDHLHAAQQAANDRLATDPSVVGYVIWDRIGRVGYGLVHGTRDGLPGGHDDDPA